MRKVSPKITPKVMTVPSAPYREMYVKFWKKVDFLRLYPPEKIIGGSNP